MPCPAPGALVASCPSSGALVASCPVSPAPVMPCPAPEALVVLCPVPRAWVMQCPVSQALAAPRSDRSAEAAHRPVLPSGPRAAMPARRPRTAARQDPPNLPWRPSRYGHHRPSCPGSGHSSYHVPGCVWRSGPAALRDQALADWAMTPPRWPATRRGDRPDMAARHQPTGWTAHPWRPGWPWDSPSQLAAAQRQPHPDAAHRQPHPDAAQRPP